MEKKNLWKLLVIVQKLWVKEKENSLKSFLKVNRLEKVVILHNTATYIKVVFNVFVYFQEFAIQDLPQTPQISLS